MGNLIVLNGSPRAPRSHSKRYAQMLSTYYPGQSAYFEITRTNHQDLVIQLDGYSDMVVVFPLYADAIPVTLLNFLKFLEAHPPQNRPTVSVLVNCGFLEAHQNDTAVQMMRLFCRKNHYSYGATLKIGSGEAILDSPFQFLAARKIRRLAAAIAQGTQETFEITMPLPKRLFVSAADSYWTNYGKKFGVTKAQMQTMKIEE